jgi:NAD+ diphosphatase
MMGFETAKSERSARTGFGSFGLDRHAEWRDDPAKLASLALQADARFAVCAGDTPILRKSGDVQGAWHTQVEATALGEERERVFLGTQGDAPRFGVLIDKALADPASVGTLKERPDLFVTDLRSIAVQGLVPPAELAPLGAAKALLDWHARHRFCAVCGAGTQPKSGGWKRACTGCSAEHFPRTDPVVIMLAVRDDKCLMARQSRFPANMYSCLAGFVEPGETFEDAVRRETWEEAGIRAGKVKFLASQPWPFPSSIMIGCIAEALNDDIVLDKVELEQGRWFTREEAILMLRRQHPDGLTAPVKIAIANTLLWAWAMEGELP